LPPASVIHQALFKVCREDFASFAMLCVATLNPGAKLLHNFHFEALAFRLDQVRRGKCKALIVNMPPRYGKSMLTSVAFPAYVLGLDPTRRIMVISHNLELAVTLSNDFRRIINSAWYKAMFPETRISQVKNTEIDVATTRGGFRLATSLRKSAIGRGAEYVIFDDPLSAADAYSDSKRRRANELVRGCLTRLDHKESGRVIIAMQRLHDDDPCGNLQRECSGWTGLCLPAIAEEDETIQIGENRHHQRRAGEALYPELESISVLNDIKSRLGSEIFSAQYQQSPVPRDGIIFKRDLTQRYDELPVRTTSSVVYQCWDTAIKHGEQHDYSACVTVMIHDKKFYVVDVVRERLDFSDLIKSAKAQAKKHKPDRILVEDSGLGTALHLQLVRAGFRAVAIKPKGDKVMRMTVQAAKCEQGQLFLPRQAPWLADFEAEFFGVPKVRHDDQVDSLCHILAHTGDGYLYNWDATTNQNFSNFIGALTFDALVRGNLR
jgi:predicted phage terminase large subunit-like protein